MELEELNAIAEREQQKQQKTHIRCCTVGGCLSANGLAVKEQLEEAVTEAGLGGKVAVSGVGCMGLCSRGPLVRVDPQGILYDSVTTDKASEIVASVINNLGAIRELPLQISPSPYQPNNHPFFTQQLKIVLENSGTIDPEKIAEYIARDGYRGLYQVLQEMTPESVIETISGSGLRGRGGAGYPTGLKWQTVAKEKSKRKFVICNGDEGDPGAFMDRSVLESDPHRVIEGMAIAG